MATIRAPFDRSRSLFLLAFILTGCGADKQKPTPVTSLAPSERSFQTTLIVVTFNVLADPVRLEERLPAISRLLEESKADVIALQEADDWLLAALEKQEWFQRDYHGTRTNGRLDAPGGQLILSRFPIDRWEFFDLPGAQGRTVVVAEVRVNGEKLTIANTHLESPLEAGEMRARQLQEISKRIGDGDAILLGDFNFADGSQPESRRLPEGFIDVWTALRPKDLGYTWHVERNHAAKVGSFPEESSGRIDRILVRSRPWKAKAVWLFGDQPIANANRFPSDHFGVRCVLKHEGFER
jgi:endonuclease/exonuclease/phosphatase family metal-dependent hydrolase